MKSNENQDKNSVYAFEDQPSTLQMKKGKYRTIEGQLHNYTITHNKTPSNPDLSKYATVACVCCWCYVLCVMRLEGSPCFTRQGSLRKRKGRRDGREQEWKEESLTSLDPSALLVKSLQQAVKHRSTNPAYSVIKSCI